MEDVAVDWSSRGPTVRLGEEGKGQLNLKFCISVTHLSPSMIPFKKIIKGPVLILQGKMTHPTDALLEDRGTKISSHSNKSCASIPEFLDTICDQRNGENIR